MPELPDIAAYITALEARIVGQPLEHIRLASPFLLRTAQPPLASAEGRAVEKLRRIGKRIAIGVEGDLWLVLHLMIAGRLHWRAARREARRSSEPCGVRFSQRLSRTDGSRLQASCIVARSRGEGNLDHFDAGGIDVFTSDLDSFRAVMTAENHTLKRALTDPRLLSGVGNAYSDEILHAAQLSPIMLTNKLSPDDWERLFAATRQTLQLWITRLGARSKTGLSGEGHRVSQRHGNPRPLRASLPEVRRQDSADSLRRQGDELLRALPDRRQGSRG